MQPFRAGQNELKFTYSKWEFDEGKRTLWDFSLL